MRVRSQSNPSQPGRHVINSNRGLLVDQNFDRPPASSQVTTDVVIPHFRARSKKGEIFNNPFDSVRTTFEDNSYNFGVASHPDGSWERHEWRGVYSLPSGPYQAYNVPVNPGSIDPERLIAQSALMAKSSINKTKFDAGTFIGEWSKTRHILGDVCKAVVKVVANRFKGGKRAIRYRTQRYPLLDYNGQPVFSRDGRQLFRYSREAVPSNPHDSLTVDTANAYLVGRYGVAPLLKDLEDAVSYMTKSYVARSTARGFASDQATATVLRTCPDATYSINCEITRVRTYSVRHGVLYESNPIMANLAYLGLTRPLSVAWELAPWSFAFDWLFNVSQWLDAIQPDGSSRTLSAWVCTLDSTVTSFALSGSGSGRVDGASVTQGSSGGAIHAEHRKTRQLWDLTVPTRPLFGGGINSTIRAVDTVALMLQQLRPFIR